MQNIAFSVYTLDKILAESIKVSEKLILKYSASITLFQSFMIEVFKEADILRNDNLQTSRVKWGGRGAESSIQTTRHC